MALKKIFILISILSTTFLLNLGCGLLDNDEDVYEYDIKYEVTGTASRADITYEDKYGFTSHESDVSLPWEYSFEAETGDYVSISAQNSGESGSVTVTIYKDGVVLDEDTSYNPEFAATADKFL